MIARYIKYSFLAAIALSGWSGLALQLYLVINSAIENGRSLPAELLRYFSYFTILTNLLVAVSVTFILIGPVSRWGKFFSRPSVQTAITLYILVVGIVYSVALRKIWNPQGLQLIADRILHDIIPVLFVLFWAFFVPKNALTWTMPLRWLIYPFIYLVYVIIRGALMDVYPYYFIDTNEVEWPQILLNIGVLFATFTVLGFLMVAISRLFKKPL